MFIQFGDNTAKQIYAVLLYNSKTLVLLLVWSIFAYCLHDIFDQKWISIPVAPISVLGVGLAILLGFRNNSAYDRWWEGRKIWGGIVNYSRTFAMQVMSFPNENDDVSKADLYAFKKEMIYRHIAWINALRMNLRKQITWHELDPFLPDAEIKALKTAKNKPTQINHQQGLRLNEAYRLGLIDSFKHVKMSESLEEFYNLQGMCERIKNTIFPYYYAFFTKLFLGVFVLMLPFALVDPLGIGMILISVLVSFVFSILDLSATITEDPFEGLPADVPMSGLCKTIEIDLRQQLGETELPPNHPLQRTYLGGVYAD